MQANIYSMGVNFISMCIVANHRSDSGNDAIFTTLAVLLQSNKLVAGQALKAALLYPVIIKWILICLSFKEQSLLIKRQGNSLLSWKRFIQH